MWQVLFQGIVTGLLYGIAGLGLVFIYRATGVVNFANGNMLTIALFSMWSVLAAGGSFPLALALGVGISALLGALTDSGIKLIKNNDELTLVMATLAIGLVLRGIGSMTWGGQTRNIRLPLPSGGMQLGVIYVEWSQLIIFLLSVIIAASAFMIINRTQTGLGMRAVFENISVARLLGVPVPRLRLIAWILGCTYAVLAATLVVPQTYLNEEALVTFALFSFAAITIGGLGNMFGTLIGGVLMGIVMNLVAYFLSSSLSHVAILLLVILVLYIRPEGLLSTKKIVKV